jgi:hypothetical protein
MSTVKTAIYQGVLPAVRQFDGWRMSRKDVLAWHQQARVINKPRQAAQPWEKAAELLEEYGSLSSEEMARLIGRHPGNVRKYLAILKAEGRAERLSDGQWVLVKRQVGAA